MFIWSRLVVKFLECFGIEEILKIMVELIKCIFSLNMDIFINLFVIKDVKVDFFFSFFDYMFFFNMNDVGDGVRLIKIFN